MKIYVASKLSNIDNAKRAIAYLISLGYEVTYDWTTHGSVNGQGPAIYRDVADAEMRGVTSADLVVAILPGGFGTHCEIGAAIALDKRVIIIGAHSGEYPCSFHYASGVERIDVPVSYGDDDAWLVAIDDAIVGKTPTASTPDASR